MKRRFSFSLRQLLIATNWVAIWGAAWATADAIYQNRLPNAVTGLILLPHFFLLIGAPFIALGTLVGHPKVGLLAGFLVAMVLLLLPVVQ